MKVKKVVLGSGELTTTLYFCPNCKKGHQLKYGIPECDICKEKIEWEEERGE